MSVCVRKRWPSPRARRAARGSCRSRRCGRAAARRRRSRTAAAAASLRSMIASRSPPPLEPSPRVAPRPPRPHIRGPRRRRSFGRCASALKRVTASSRARAPHLVERLAVRRELLQRSAELSPARRRRRRRAPRRAPPSRAPAGTATASPGHQVLEQLVRQREPGVVGLGAVDHEPDVVGGERGDERFGRQRWLDADTGQALVRRHRGA